MSFKKDQIVHLKHDDRWDLTYLVDSDQVGEKVWIKPNFPNIHGPTEIDADLIELAPPMNPEMTRPNLLAYLKHYFPDRNLNYDAGFEVQQTGEIYAVSQFDTLIGMFGQQAFANFVLVLGLTKIQCASVIAQAAPEMEARGLYENVLDMAIDDARREALTALTALEKRGEAVSIRPDPSKL